MLFRSAFCLTQPQAGAKARTSVRRPTGEQTSPLVLFLLFDSNYIYALRF